jgi:UDP-N-acetylglucosamine 1-carboxyvinyltransferase
VEKVLVAGGNQLAGEVRISGSKNSALAIMAAALCADGVTLLENVPDIGDIHVMMEMLDELGCKSRWTGDHRLEIDTAGLTAAGDSSELVELVRKMRASFTILGPLLARFGEARVALPGGCEIGTRSVDFHIKGLHALGADVHVEHGYVIAKTERLNGAKILLDFPSVGATNHLLSTAVLAEGRTIIENAAQEPEIVDLARFLSAMGARIKGAGTHRIEVDGVKRLNPTRHRIIPDRIEAATYAVAAAATQGDIVIRNVVEDHLLPIILKLRECGVEIESEGPSLRLFDIGRALPPLCSIRVKSKLRSCRPAHVTASPHPGFPTDAHPVLASMLTVADGASIVTETVYDRRFRYCSELQRMGANVTVSGQNALIEGVERLTGAQVSAPDLRGGAALVLAGLIAEGETEVTGLQYIDRGYEAFVPKLQQLGAEIERVSLESGLVRPALCIA